MYIPSDMKTFYLCQVIPTPSAILLGPGGGHNGAAIMLNTGRADYVCSQLLSSRIFQLKTELQLLRLVSSLPLGVKTSC